MRGFIFHPIRSYRRGLTVGTIALLAAVALLTPSFVSSAQANAVCDAAAAMPGAITSPNGDYLGDPYYAGTGGADIFVGTSGEDRMYGYGGDDLACGMGDSDVFTGDDGNDDFYGGLGDDWGYGDAVLWYADELHGGPGNDGPAGRLRQPSE